MSRIIWVSGLFVLLIWSLVSWGLAFLFTDGAAFLSAQAKTWSWAWPEAELVVVSISDLLARFGTAVAWFVWAIGAASVLFGTWLTVQVAGLGRRLLARTTPHAARAVAAVRERFGALSSSSSNRYGGSA